MNCSTGTVRSGWYQDTFYIGDASIFPNPTDKTPTMPIIAFAMRTCDHMLRNFKQGIHKRA
jgi:choline dehydrogenase-like flavoprotein